ncbi:MAG TPA: hypothetical protein VF996_03680 [Candidatus Saccharimonadales bacterium]|jgi:hypothetical protein
MPKLNQSGFIGVIEIAAIVVLLTVVGFTAWRISGMRADVDRSLNNSDDSSESSTLNPIKVNEPEDEEKEVTIPEKEVPKETVAVAQEEKPKPQTEEVKKKINYIKFDSRSASQNGDSIAASGVLASSQSGTCHFKFKKDGQEKVYKTASISNSKTCSKNIPASDFSVSGEWQYYIWFTSSDNKVQAYADILGVEVTL